MIIKDKRISELIYKIRGCVFNVYNALGPYYVEKFYEHALMIELSDNGIEAKRQVEIPTYYKDRKLDLTLKADIIVKNVIRLAEDLQIISLAEGVETVEQFERLKELGCHLFQGYYFSKPIPVADFEELVSKS